jgi:Zn-dependent protease with chaperone function
VRIELTLYRGIHPAGEPAVLEVMGRDANLSVVGSGEHWTLPVGQVHLLAAQGNQRRLVSFANGWNAESQDVEAFDQMARLLGRHRFSRVIHLLESRYRWALLAVACMGLFCVWLYLYGIPMVSRSIAYKLPVEVAENLSRSTWEYLDQWLFHETELSEEEQDFYQQAFAEMVSTLDSPFRYRLYLRNGRRIGANAFALPSGEIVVTDQLIKRSEHPHEILSIIAHEIGHVEMRHGLSQVIRSSIVFVSFTVVFGDISGVGGLGAELPVILMETGYSRKMEREADAYALQFMLKQDMDPIHFANIMQRLDPRKNSELTDTLNYIESHPVGEDRIRPFLEASENLRK